MSAKVQFLSHSGVKITTPGGKVLLIDPWTTGNPLEPFKLEEIAGPGMADLLLITHDHMDHVTDAPAIAQSSGATVVAIHELTVKLQELGVPQGQTINWGFGMNIGGSFQSDGITVTMVQAVHSSPTGAPVGFFLELEDGTTIYHAGDTDVFQDMSLIGGGKQINLAFLPIGGCFTMGPEGAAQAVKILKPRIVVPIHFKTFPFLVQTAEEFWQLAREIAELKPKEVLEF